MTDHTTLNRSNFAALGVIVDAADGEQKVTRMVDEDNLVHGIARHLVTDESGGFIGANDDIRDAYLRVTSKTGFEHFWPVSELVEDVRHGRFAIQDWSPR